MMIFDRTQADADRAAYLIGKIQRGEMLTEAEQAEYNAGLRGCYNITDLNRVEAKVRELAETLRSYGYSVDYTVPLKGASALPSGYTELEYIQSSGTQYVDTGMKTTNETSIIMDAQVLAMNQEQYGGGLLFGSCHPGQNSGHAAYVWQYKFNAVYNSTANVDTQTLTVGDRLRVEFMKNVCTVIKNGQVFYTHTFSPSSFTSTVNLYLFVLPRSTQYFGKIKLYSCEIFEGSSLVRKFIPCKNPAGTVGLYDLVGGEFYTTPTAAEAVALPEGYTQVEYLQSSGAQYIDTGFKPDGETTVNITFQTSSAPDNLNDTLPVYGAATDYNSNAFEFWTLSRGFATYGSQDYKSNLGITTGKKHTVSQAKNVLTVDGTSYTFTKQTFTAPYSLLLFATHRSSGIKICASAASLKIYSCKIYNNGTLVRDFVPVKNSSGTIGLYDLVNSAFYTNAGSGTFTAGADIVGFTAGAEAGKAEDRDWQYGDTMLESDVLLYLENIAALRDVIQMPPDVPPIPTIDRWIDWMAANDIERIVFELDRMIYGIVPLFRRCGTFRAGKNAQHLLLAKGVN